EESSGVVPAGEFLRTYNIRGSVPVGRKVVVVGGGNAAVDAARTALRLGAEAVTIIYRRTREQMPAYAEEIEEALHEGVELRPLVQPIEVVANERGETEGLRCETMTLGSFDRSGRRRPTRGKDGPFVLPADQIIVAIGQRLDAGPIAGLAGLELNEHGFIATDLTTGQTSVPWIFAGGDSVSGPSSVVDAIAAGERAAVGINLLLTGRVDAFWREESEVETSYDPDAEPAPYPREAYRTIAVERRRQNFDEVEQPWCEAVTMRQAQRCLRCDYGKKIPRAAQPNPVVPVGTKEGLRA
ncbi:MAG: FAD-dependent oxidoreductase, partial [Spirochaetota bacterium]